MENFKIENTENGHEAHVLVALFAKKNGKHLLALRKQKPAGIYAPIVGHVQHGEGLLEAMNREIEEEAGKGIVTDNLHHIHTQLLDSPECRHGVTYHQWNVFTADVCGTIKPDGKEADIIDWYYIKSINDQLGSFWKTILKEIDLGL